MASLYDIIDDLRREHQSSAATRTLDMVVVELGETRDNLKQALSRLDGQPLPSGGREVLEQLAIRARAAGIDDVTVPLSPEELRENEEPVTPSQVGIAVVLGGTALLSVVLVALAILFGLNQILHFM
jgi:hypothetical protein